MSPALPSGVVLPLLLLHFAEADSSVGIKSSQHDWRHWGGPALTKMRGEGGGGAPPPQKKCQSEEGS